MHHENPGRQQRPDSRLAAGEPRYSSPGGKRDMVTPEYLPCPQCPVRVEVSEEDPDASLSDLWAHLGCHTHDHRLRQELFVQAQQDAS